MTSDPVAKFAASLKQLRAERGLTLRELADRAHYSKSYVHELESGQKPPTADAARQLDEALAAGGRLSSLIPAPQSLQAAPMNVRAAVADPEPMGEPEMESLHDTVMHLVALDTLHGSEGLYANAARAFRNSQRHLAVAGARPAVRSDVHAALAELGEVAAWLAYDSEQQDLSRTVATDALLIAHLAGDTSMARFLLSHLAMQAVYIGRPAEGLAIADRVIAEEPRSRRVVGMMRVRRARALGRLGDTSTALVELAVAREDLAEGVGPDDPSWTWWWHAAELAVHEARIRSGGGDARGAAEASERSILHLPAGQGRDQSLFRAWLLSDLVDVGAWSEADQVAWQLMEKAPIVGSARVPRIVRAAARRAARVGAPGWLTDAIREAADAADSAA